MTILKATSRVFLGFVLAALAAANVGAQTVQQTGAIVPGHVGLWIAPGALSDSGFALGGPVGAVPSELSVQSTTGLGPNGENLCSWDAPVGSPRHYICFTSNVGGKAQINVGQTGGATPLGLTFNINGTAISFPGPGTGTVVGPGSSVSGNLPSFNGTTGNIIQDSGIAASAILTQSAAAALYAPLISPALTGTPTAPTQAGSDNSTKLATTAWVKGQGYLQSGAFAAGFVNKLRNAALFDWFSGFGSLTITTAGGWGPEGIFIVPTGASITTIKVANPQVGLAGVYGAQINGAGAVTDVKLRFPIESFDVAPLAGQVATFQLCFQNKSGASLTPIITTKFPTAQDNYTASTVDINAQSMTTLSNNAIACSAYTFTLSASAVNGYTITVDLGALTSGNSVVLTGFDFRLTPGVSAGPNNSPPSPIELRNPSENIAWDRRFFNSTYTNGTAPGTATRQSALVEQSTITTGLAYPYPLTPPMRCAAPTIVGYSPNTGAINKYYDVINNVDVNVFAAVFVGPNAVIIVAAPAAGVDAAIAAHLTVDCRITGS